MVKKIANSTQRDRFEDAVQDGIFGIIRAIQTYDVMKGGFSTYMYMWVRRTMQERTGYKEFTVLDGIVALSEQELSDYDTGMKQRKITVNPEDITTEDKDTLWLHEAISTLDAREKLVIDLIYFHDATLAQCMEVMSLSKVTVHKIHHEALRKLRVVLA